MTTYDVDKLPDRLRAKVFVNGITGCWEWLGAKTDAGYGEAVFDGRRRPLHRVVYELFVAAVSPRQQLDHLCRMRSCVNPAHLDPVSVAENMRRGVLGGMQPPIAPASAPAATGLGQLLDDVLTVIGADESAAWSEVVAARLATLKPDRYGDWGKFAFGEAMRGAGVPVVQIARSRQGHQTNRRGVRRQDVEAAAIRNRPGQVA